MHIDCPNCGRGLFYDRKDTSFASGTRYEREHYRCGVCGTWVTVETPEENEK